MVITWCRKATSTELGLSVRRQKHALLERVFVSRGTYQLPPPPPPNPPPDDPPPLENPELPLPLDV